MQQKILLASDGSETSKKAAAFTAELAGASNPEVTVITVITVPKGFYSRRLYWTAKERPSEAAEIKSFFLEEAQRVLNETVAVLDRHGIKADTIIREGDAAEEISKCAHEGGFTHIVMGTRGLGNVKEFFLGSVAHKVVNLSNIPVTLVK